MKFTLSWLKDHLDTDATLEQLSETLSAIGLEVEAVHDPAATLGAFTVAKILDAQPHPDADRLQVCQVEIAPGAAPLEIVCGAPNARAGLITVFAPIGTYVPGIDVTLEKRKVRGVASNGMLCSAAELELAGDADGIMDLGDAAAARIGDRYIDLADLNDPVFDVGLTPNRPDCTGVRGIARDLAAAGLGTLKPVQTYDAVEGKTANPIAIDLKFDAATTAACPVFAGRHVAGVTNGPSPAWLQNRLTAIGLRPINALVDVTNYIAYDQGRPLHVYDADKLKGTVHARLGADGETFVGLDDKTHTVTAQMCVIADDNGVLGLGGVMGGLATGCTQTTTNVLIESALFDPVRIAETGRATGLITDARYRFERGVDPASVMPGLDQATAMIVALAGGTPSKAAVAGAITNTATTLNFNPARVAKLTGVALSSAEIRTILEALGFGVTTAPADAWSVTVPTWRPDVHGVADLVEEVVRIAGLDKIPSTPLPPAARAATAVLTPLQKRVRTTRRVLAARGLTEAVTYSFITEPQATAFGGGDVALKLANPISSEMSDMRPSLLPGLLTAAQRNRNVGAAAVALFEIGQAYRGIKPDDQRMHAAGIRTDTAKPHGSGRHWREPATPIDLFDAKADALACLAALGINTEAAQVTRDAPAWYHPGRSGTLRLGPKVVLAHFGALHPTTLKALDVAAPAVAFEIDLSGLPPEKRKSRMRQPLAATDLLPVHRDFAFVVDAATAAGDLVRAAQNADKTLITSVDVFDCFEGGALASDGKKSLGLQVTLQPTAKTLTDDDIEAVCRSIVQAVTKKTGGAIRS